MIHAKIYYQLLTIAFGIALALGKVSENGCEIPIGSKQHYIYQWPLVYDTNGKLYTTQTNELGERVINVGEEAEVLLSCGPNYLKKFNKQEVLKVKCNGESGNFHVVTDEAEGKADVEREWSNKELSCDLRVVEEVLSTVNGCLDDKWTATTFGYVDPTEKLTYLLGEACYDAAEGRTLFAHVKMNGKAPSYLQKLRKNFLTTQRHPDGRYKIELFRGLHFDEIYERIRTKLHIQRAPPMKMSNFIDETLLGNAQYQAVKKLGWNYFVAHDELEVLKTLKLDIKALSNEKDLDVYVGSHGVQTLYGANGAEMEVYVQAAPKGEKGRFPVPELIWIVVKSEDKATAFGVYNDGAMNTLEESEHVDICKSVCDKVTWLAQSLNDAINSSPLICCNLEEFRKNVKEVPALGSVTEMLL